MIHWWWIPVTVFLTYEVLTRLVNRMFNLIGKGGDTSSRILRNLSHDSLMSLQRKIDREVERRKEDTQ